MGQSDRADRVLLGARVASHDDQGMSARRWLGVLAALALAALTPSAGSAGAVSPSDPGVSFVLPLSGRDAPRSLVCVVADAEGALPRQATSRRAAYISAALSPRGDRLAAVVSIRGQQTLVVSRLDGSSHRVVASRARSPVWSLDGTKIAFLRDNAVFVADRYGRGVRRLTTPLGRLQRDESPGWLRSGRIYFVRSRIGPVQAELISIRPDGTSWRTEHSWGENVAGIWSPDLTKRAFLDEGRLIVTTADASASWRIAGDRQSPVAEPAWSADGARLAFVQRGSPTVPGSSEVFTANADGSGLRQLTHDKIEARSPAWTTPQRTARTCVR